MHGDRRQDNGENESNEFVCARDFHIGQFVPVPIADYTAFVLLSMDDAVRLYAESPVRVEFLDSKKAFINFDAGILVDRQLAVF